MEDFLKEQLERTNYWLSFSEAKNAALVAFNVAIIAVCTQLSAILFFMQAIICDLFFISTIICLLSFYSNLRGKIARKERCNLDELNLLFYKDVAKINNKDMYFNSLKKKYKLDIEKEKTTLYNDYISEIIINSEITVYKCSMFNKAMFVDVFSVLVFVLSFIIA